MKLRRNYAKLDDERHDREVRARINEKREELRRIGDDLRQYQRDSEAFRTLRDAEPAVQCDNCRAEMRTGDWCCHACRTPNPEYIFSGIDPPAFPKIS